jgi:hypothetical protein
VVVLSHGLWQRRFGGDRAVWARPIRLNGEPWTIVGVMPARLEHVGGDYVPPPQGETVEAWSPVPLDEAQEHRSWHYLKRAGTGSLTGATPAQAAAELRAHRVGTRARVSPRRGCVAAARRSSLTDAWWGRPARVLLLTGAAALRAARGRAPTWPVSSSHDSLARRRELVVRFGPRREPFAPPALPARGGRAPWPRWALLSGWWSARAGLPRRARDPAARFPAAAMRSPSTGECWPLTVALSLVTVLLFGLAPRVRARGG